MARIRRRRVVVGVGPDTPLAVVDAAAAEAALRGLPLRMYSIHPGGGPGPRDSLTALLRRACTLWPGLTVTARNITGDPGPLLIEASRTAKLVVVGQDRVGTCAAQVAAHSYCPTLVVPPGTAHAGGPVLLGLAAERDEEPAIEFAFEAAEVRRVPLVAAHVWAGLPGDALGGIDPFAYDLGEAYAAADRIVAERVAGWAGKFPDVEVDRMPLYDPNPASTMRDASTMAGLIVVGARRADARSGQLLGPVTRALLAGSACPVAVVRLTHPAYG